MSTVSKTGSIFSLPLEETWRFVLPEEFAVVTATEWALLCSLGN